MEKKYKMGVPLPDFDEIIQPEDYRVHIFPWSVEIAKEVQTREMGVDGDIGSGSAAYLLTAADLVPDDEDLVPIPLGALKKDFTTAKMLVRHAGVKFMVTRKGKPLLGFTRNPQFQSAAVDRLLREAPPHVREAVLGGKPASGQVAVDPKQNFDVSAVLNRLEEMEVQAMKRQERLWSWLETKLK